MTDHNNSPEIIKTGDGSHSLYLANLDETYHSRHGAMQESQFVFIQNGLEQVAKKIHSIKILEVGFGTGLNALLTWEFSTSLDLSIEYHSLETNPLSNELMTQYAIGLGWSDERIKQFLSMHSAEWEHLVKLDNNFSLKKCKSSIQDFDPSQNSFDLIYYDAFGPRAQPEMWNKTIFMKLYDCLQSNGVFVTYCAKGQVRRDLSEVGFEMERLPGPPGKREMLRGIKS
ncbi:MAG: tRNA (5-methylaminomethyl-2-thiouridine)(34)-methyltransferase MnmD [Flavobacteriales bacterium]